MRKICRSDGAHRAPVHSFTFLKESRNRRHFNSCLNEVRHNYIMHFFLPKSESQNRTSFPGKAQCFCFWSLMISLSTAVANKSASSSSRKELPSWLPALLRVSAAEPKGWKAAHRGGGLSLLTEPCSAHLPLYLPNPRSRLPPGVNQIPEGLGLEETQ